MNAERCEKKDCEHLIGSGDNAACSWALSDHGGPVKRVSDMTTCEKSYDEWTTGGDA